MAEITKERLETAWYVLEDLYQNQTVTSDHDGQDYDEMLIMRETRHILKRHMDRLEAEGAEEAKP